MKRRHRQPISNINVVPYLDVMLVLLVIFMITAPLFNQGVVDLPSVGDETELAQQPSGALEIVYHYAKGNPNPFHIINHELDSAESERMNLPELMDKLAEETLLRPDAPIIIQADGSLEYKEVIELLGRLQAENFKNIGLVVKNSEE